MYKGLVGTEESAGTDIGEVFCKYFTGKFLCWSLFKVSDFETCNFIRM